MSAIVVAMRAFNDGDESTDSPLRAGQDSL